MRILLAEDDDLNRKVELLMLDHLGYKADVAVNGLEVMRALKRKPYDLILMDLRMPEMDGLETTSVIRKRCPEDRQPKIISMTAWALPNIKEICMEAGMDDCLIKPIQLDDLRELLPRYLS
jgi:CheY-like chemotaxis protein